MSLLTVLLYCLLPFAGCLIGGVIALIAKISDTTLSLALHAATGIVLAVVGVELMPRIMLEEKGWLIFLALMGGGVFSILVDIFAEKFSGSVGKNASNAAPWVIYISVCIDLLSDGLMIGTSSTIEAELALLVGIAQVAGNFPEAFATIATLKGAGIERAGLATATALFALPIFGGGLIGYLAVRDASEELKMVILAFTAAMLIKASVEEMIVHAHAKAEHTHLQEFSFIAGFALFVLMSAYF